MSLVGMRAGECVGEVFLTVIIPHFSIPDLLEENLSTPSSAIFVALAGTGQHGPLSPLEAKPITMTATVGENTYTYTKDSFSFDINKYYVYDVKMTKQE